MDPSPPTAADPNAPIPTLPYAGPPVPATPVEPPPPYKLFDVLSITLATFLGSPLAGAVLMAVNYRRLDRPKQATMAVIFGILGTAALIGIGMMLPDRVPSAVVAIVPVIIMNSLAKAVQGEDLTKHSARRGGLVSRWAAAGIGAAFLVLILGLFFGGALIESSLSLGHKLQYSSTDEIYYRKDATQADAQKLGDTLKQLGYFGVTSNSKTVLLTKDATGTTITFILGNGWNDPSIIAAFQAAGASLTSTFGKPLTIRLADQEQKVQKELKIN